MTGLEQRVVDTIRRHGLWSPGQPVWVAVSGGSDSVALLDVLVATDRLHGGRLAVVHVDHGLHPESAQWAADVRALATDAALPCVVERVALPIMASEDAARTARYEVFDRLPPGVVALAHHQSDQAETALMQLIRGTSRGPRGMRRHRGRFVRPVLGVPSADLRRRCTVRGLSTITDPANSDDRYLRVRVRSTLIPTLEDIREGATRSLARAATVAGEEDDWLEAAARQLSGPALTSAPRVLQRRRVRQLLEPVTMTHVERVMDALAAGKGRVQISGGRSVVVSPEGLRIDEGG